MQNSSSKRQLSIREIDAIQKNKVPTDSELVSNINLINGETSQDIFDIGLILLQCALGGFEVYDVNNFYATESIKQVLDKVKSSKMTHRYCCLLHNEEILREMCTTPSISVSTFNTKKQPLTNNFSIKSPRTILSIETVKVNASLYQIFQQQGRYSESFIDLLCLCLKIGPTERSDAKALLNHEFFSKNHVSLGPKILMSEIMNVYNSNFSCKMEDQRNKNANNFLNVQVDRFLEGLKMVFMSGDVRENFDQMLMKTGVKEINNRKIIDLATELECDPVKLWKIIMKEIVDK